VLGEIQNCPDESLTDIIWARCTVLTAAEGSLDALYDDQSSSDALFRCRLGYPFPGHYVMPYECPGHFFVYYSYHPVLPHYLHGFCPYVEKVACNPYRIRDLFSLLYLTPLAFRFTVLLTAC